MNDKTEDAVRQPSMLDALIPLLFMIVLLSLSIILFGIDAAVGLLQVSLLMSAVVAAVVAHKNGHSWEKLGDEIVKGISLAMGAILILLMVGALIGVWNMSGTIATVIYYGIKYIDPTWFYLAAALLTGIIRSSPAAPGPLRLQSAWHLSVWEQQLASPCYHRLSGPFKAYFGDKMTPVGDDHFDTANRGQQRTPISAAWPRPLCRPT